MHHQVFLLGCLLDEKSCQEYKYICLYKSIKDIKITTEYCRDDCRDDHL